MSRCRRVLSRAAVLVAATLALTAVGDVLPVYAVSSHRTLNDTRPVGAGVVVVDFPIEYFALVADLAPPDGRLVEPGPAPFGQARFRVGARWSPWQDLDQDGAQAPGHFTGALVAVDHADAYQVRNLPTGARNWRAAAINTTDGPTVTVRKVRSAATASPMCRSRADWGADETMSGWSRGDTQTFFPVQALTVHHTAGSNDLGQDFAATVRAIYSYHVQSNGWSDVGYQYLVDGTGVVYEGRNSGHISRSCLSGGGDGSDFAHQTGTDNVVTGAHVESYNSGNAGIALMGCYEPTSVCAGATTPPTAAVERLEVVLASLSKRHGLDPMGRIHYVNPVTGATRDVATISAHRDWDSTTCPGGNLYAQLPAIRINVAARVIGTPAATVPGAPSSLTASANGGSVALSWAPPATDGGAALTRYEVFRDTTTPVSTSATPVFSGTATSATDKPGTGGAYYYAVRACNSVGCGPTTTAGPVALATPPRVTSASCSGATCTFVGKGTPTLRWVFGNGERAAGPRVSATYRSRGAFTVTLIDGRGSQVSRVVVCGQLGTRIHCKT